MLNCAWISSFSRRVTVWLVQSKERTTGTHLLLAWVKWKLSFAQFRPALRQATSKHFPRAASLSLAIWPSPSIDMLILLVNASFCTLKIDSRRGLRTLLLNKWRLIEPRGSWDGHILFGACELVRSESEFVLQQRRDWPANFLWHLN
jgi:hypothetical protein